MNGSPAAARSASKGSVGLSASGIDGKPVIWKSALVAFFISFSIQPPDG